MNATFVELPPFARVRASYLDDSAYLALQNELMANPQAGDVIEGTGGLRKLRQPDPKRGRDAVKASVVAFESSITGGWVASSFGFSLFTTKTKRTT